MNHLLPPICDEGELPGSDASRATFSESTQGLANQAITVANVCTPNVPEKRSTTKPVMNERSKRNHDGIFNGRIKMNIT